MNRQTFKLAVLSLLLVHFAKGQDAKTIVAQYLEAIGGRENWVKMSTLHLKGIHLQPSTDIFSTSGKRNDTTFFEIYFKRPFKHRYTKMTKRSKTGFTICFNNDTLWTGSIGGEKTIQ